MTSVERNMDYVNIKPEAALESSKELKPSSDWPESGEILAKDVSMTYTEDGPPVLKEIHFKISPREKVNTK